MPQLDAIVAVMCAGFAMSLTPGPSMLYVLSRSVGQSRTAGLASALGLGVGGALLAIATAFGLAVLFERIEWLVKALKYAGSGYLVWLGVGLISKAQDDARQHFQAAEVDQDPFLGIFWQGVLVELLNPKTVLFFALFIPPFVDIGVEQGAAGNLHVQLLVLGALVPLTALPSDMVVAFFGGSFAKLANDRQETRRITAIACGITLIAIAIVLHL